MTDTSPFCSPSSEKRIQSRRLNFIGTCRKSLSQLEKPIIKSQITQEDLNGEEDEQQTNVASTTTESPVKRRPAPASMRKNSSVGDMNLRMSRGGSQRGRGQSRRNTGIPRGPKRITQGAVELPLKISIETPNLLRLRSQQATKEDKLLRQKKVM